MADKTFILAERELKKYLKAMTGSYGEIELRSPSSVSIMSEDICEYKVTGGKGIIKANSPRALLLGVYDFLRKCGCRFLRPGKDGEVVPKNKIEKLSATGVFRPKNKHRGITIEGAVSYENILEIIEWAPKVGFNSYFTQFMNSYEFFRRWYNHDGNEYLYKEEITLEKAKKYLKVIVDNIKERSMIYHAVGHGWTSQVLGIESKGWEKQECVLTPEKQAMIAMINGKREFFNGKPLNTNLCLSNEAVQESLSQAVLEYAINHPETDVVHFWLADDINNVCECEECSKKSFSDWYVTILNKIDKKLSDNKLTTKICFLIYFDLYWAPEKERIQNEDRFIMMFAPIFRSYDKSFVSGGKADGKVIEYKKNKMEYPRDTAPYLDFLREWKNVYKGDTFDFDYHLMWDINRDMSGKTISETLYKDIRSLKEIGLNGFMSCQIQRAFYPNGFTFYMLGRVLSEEGLTYESIEKEYYQSAFGSYKEYAKKTYLLINQYLPFGFLARKNLNDFNLSKFIEFKKVLKEIIANFPCCVEGIVVLKSLELLRFLLENLLKMMQVIIAKVKQENEDIIKLLMQERVEFFNLNEKKFQPYVDGFYFLRITESMMENLLYYKC